MLHGFGQNGRCWGRLGTTLQASHAVTALDLSGHGSAGAVDADLWTSADLVAAAIDPDRPASLVGYSMGGRVALHVALAHPELVQRLVLISATAGIDDDRERDRRHAEDHALADRIEEIGTHAFVDEWLARPMFAGLPADGRFDDERRSNHPRGLASSLRHAGTGTQDPLWSRLGELEMPVLVLAGQDDDKYAALAERLAAGIGHHATLAVVGSSGHSVHLEQPALTADLVSAWLARP